MSETIRVLSVDDHAFLAEGLQTRLAGEPDIEFVGWLGSAERLLDELERTGATVVLMDIEMPGPDPFATVREVRAQFPDVRVVMLSAYVRDRYIDAALEAGAWGYLSKADQPETVVESIRRVARGEFTFGAEVLERCPPATSGGRPASKLDRLTARELQVLRLIGKGLGRFEIAASLHRSAKTIDNHRAAIMEKLGLHDRVELARYAISEGLVEPD